MGYPEVNHTGADWGSYFVSDLSFDNFSGFSTLRLKIQSCVHTSTALEIFAIVCCIAVKRLFK